VWPARDAILAGKYRVERPIGEGGCGRVVAARHVALDQVVAIKLLKRGVLPGGEAVGRFLREARVVARLRSEHVARVLDVGTLENGDPYMVMEYLEGDDLATVLDRAGTLGVEEAVEHVLQACHGLAEAHALGIIHRDLKPANLFLTRTREGQAQVKVLDFGISKVAPTGGDAPTGLTKSHKLLGSPWYMSPEQIAAPRKVDARSDIWSVGIILFQLLAGRMPFDSMHLVQLCVSITQDPTPPLRQWAPAVPRELEAVIERCLSKRPEGRFPDLVELSAALVPFGGPQAPVLGRRIAALLAR
jgi:serine/threonine protein kinase